MSNISYHSPSKDKLVITIDLAKAPNTASKSGKSRILASTNGNVTVPLADGKTAKLGLNLYEPIS